VRDEGASLAYARQAEALGLFFQCLFTAIQLFPVIMYSEYVCTRSEVEFP
jgi:hypothetical protein